MKATVAPLPLFLVAAQAVAQQGTLHDLPLTPEHVHWGYYDARVAPVLTVRSGDRVRIETMIARGLERLALAGGSPEEFHPAVAAVERAVTERGPGAHPLTDPIRVEDAEPGDVLEVRILDIGVLDLQGVSGFLPGGGTLPDDYPYGALRLFLIDTVAGVARMNDDLAVPLRPFFGSIGVAPPLLSGAGV